MRYLVTCWPFAGHLHPQMAVATALRARGHEVAFYSGRSIGHIVESEGFAFFPMTDVDESEVTGLVRVLETGSQGARVSPGLLRRTLRGWLVDTIPDQVSDIRRVMGDWSPDVIITDLSLWATMLVLWESTPIPVALSSTFLGPLVPGRDAPAFGLGMRPPRSAPGRLLAYGMTGLLELAGRGLRRRVDELRAGYGLGPLGCSVNEFTGRLPLYLVPSLAELDGNRRDLPSTVHYVGPVLWNPPATAAEREWLGYLPHDRPWVHVTESTLRYGDPFLLRAAIDGLGGSDVEVVATTGDQRDAEQLGLGGIPDNVHLRPWLSHAELMGQCSVLVTTGGSATVMAALRAGVPVVVVPTTWDKPDNARRVVQAGVGVRLRAGRCSPDRLRAAVEEVLGNPAYAVRARALSRRLASASGPDLAATLLESLGRMRVVR